LNFIPKYRTGFDKLNLIAKLDLITKL